MSNDALSKLEFNEKHTVAHQCNLFIYLLKSYNFYTHTHTRLLWQMLIIVVVQTILKVLIKMLSFSQST